MILILMLQFVLSIFILIFLITQIILPFIRSTPFFPIFLNEANLQREIEKCNQELIEKKMEDEISKKRDINKKQKLKKKGNL